ncbi:MAG: polymer-forming cytoskeletal protein [Bacteroidia bacterium]|nr:polymer-forming cytoskeletal protein [Bacteroidia bacterium]MCX7764092.1 polymer-forming cytoskeletal protein [Bacteroidia bacterium]MDW8058195.1 polymer-forming cytoskeletal protein [Bacteroidia bacterium]
MSFWKRGSSLNGAYEKALSLLGEGSSTRGEFQTPGNLRIEGHFEGKLKVEGRLVLAPSAEVRGEIHAVQVHVAGRFAGEIVAEDVVEVAPTAQIQGEIRARRLECERGASLQVHCLIGEGIFERQEVPSPATSKNRK